jgi:hypothetical protein
MKNIGTISVIKNPKKKFFEGFLLINVFFLFSLFLLNPYYIYSQTSATYTSSGSWTCPNGVYQVQVECWGGGGGGSTRTTNGSGGGGGGGAYASSTLSVIPGNIYTIAVGTGGGPAVNGGSSSFDSPATVLALGGSGVASNTSTGGTGGLATGCIGTLKFNGGSGANGSGTTYGGGGGGGAGSSGIGGTSVNATGGSGTANYGGNGGNGRSTTQGNGLGGNVYGGGGGGALRTSTSTRTGGTGAGGYVTVTYTIPASPGAITSNSPQCTGTGITFTQGSCTTGCTCYWVSSSTGTETTNSSSTFISATSEGTYTVWVRARNNTTGNWSAAVSATGTIGIPAATASYNSPVCEGSTLTLTALPNSMVSYSWSGPDGFISSDQNPTVSVSTTPAMAGTYTVTVTSGEGCTTSRTTIVTINTIPSSCANTPTPSDAATGISVSQVLSWSSVSGATSYDVYFGISSSPLYYTTVSGASFAPSLYINTTYYWYVVPKNSCGNASGCSATVWSFTTSGSCGGDAYKSNVASGNWASASTWLVSVSGGAWTAASAYPTSANACSAEICSGHTITVNANVNAPNTVIDAGGTLTNAAFNLTYGSGYNLTNNGTLTCSVGGSSITAWDGKGIFIDGTATLINYGTVTVNTTGVISLANTTAGSVVVNYGTINNNGGGYYWDGISGTTNYYGGINASSTRASTLTNYATINNNGVNLTAAGNYRAMLQLFHFYNYTTFNNIYKRANTQIEGEFTNFYAATTNNSGNVGISGTGPATNYNTYNENWCTTLDNGVVFTNSTGATITLGVDGCLRALANKVNGTLYAQVINNGTITNGNMWTPSNVDGLITVTLSGRITSYTNNNIIIDNGPIKNGGTFTNTTASQFIYQETTGSISGNSLKYKGNALLNYNGSIAQTTSNYEFPLSASDSPSYVEISNSSGVSNGVTLHAARTIMYNTVNPPSNGVPYLILTEGALKLNGFILTINNSSASAISRNGTTQTGYIVSEQNAATNNSIITWNCSTTTGDFVFPFGSNDGSYIPLTFQKTTATSSDISISTRTTLIDDNTPWATGITDMNCIEGTNSSISSVIDRWWNITPSAAVTADVTFSYRGAENTTTGPNPNLALQRWDAGGGYWNDGKGGSGGTYSSTGTEIITGIGVGAATAFGLTQFTNLILLLEGSSLPVELVIFNAVCEDNKTKISWITASETNNDYFSVERSPDAVEWEQLVYMDGAGNSNTSINYKAEDNEPFNNISYYRLKQVDFDGQYSYSSEVPVSCYDNHNLELISVTQDGNDDLVVIFTSSEGENCILTLYDYSGKQIFSKQLQAQQNTNEVHFNTAGICEGLYLFGILSSTKCLEEKILLMK